MTQAFETQSSTKCFFGLSFEQAVSAFHAARQPGQDNPAGAVWQVRRGTVQTNVNRGVTATRLFATEKRTSTKLWSGPGRPYHQPGFVGVFFPRTPETQSASPFRSTIRFIRFRKNRTTPKPLSFGRSLAIPTAFGGSL